MLAKFNLKARPTGKAAKKQVKKASASKTLSRNQRLKMLADNGMWGELSLVLKHDVGGSVPLDNPVHGTGGMFSEPGAREGVYSAISQPRSWLDDLPFYPSEYENETIELLTWASETNGSNPADYCGEPVTPGDLYKCAINRTFGRMFVGGKKVIVPDIGALKNRGDTERRILNWASRRDPLLPDLLQEPGLNLRSASAKNLLEIAISARRAIAPTTIDGDSSLAYTSTEDGFIKEFDGLSRIIKEGTLDIHGEACPAADSLVIDWSAAVDDEVGGMSLPAAMHDAYYSREQLAYDTGFEGFGGEFVMDKRMFRALAFVFACTYANARCGDGAVGTPISREMSMLESRFNEMLEGQYLLIAGKRVPVRFTAGTEVTDNEDTTFSTDIWFVPMVWSGGDLTYMQFFPLDNQYIREWLAMANTTDREILNGGLYMIASRSNGFCDQLVAASKMRLMVDTPFLGFRIDNIDFTSYAGFRSWDPNDTNYFFSGGVSGWND